MQFFFPLTFLGLNYLKDWTNGTYPQGWDKKPVTWIGLEDMAAYAKWAGKRLLNEWEWQYAAQGNKNYTYPWGNTFDPTRIPVPSVGMPPLSTLHYPHSAVLYALLSMILPLYALLSLSTLCSTLPSPLSTIPLHYHSSSPSLSLPFPLPLPTGRCAHASAS
jgi:hypothetical protein